MSANPTAFRERIQRVRGSLSDRGIAWYRYDSLANIDHIARLLEGTGLTLDKLPAGRSILDVGCADGDFAFYLEQTLNVPVTVVDHPATNHNGMQAVRALKEALGSKIEILEFDVDRQFVLGERRFGLVIALGILYHLKNPFFFLETLARHSRYALVSTRIARYLPDNRTDIAQTPLGYLLGSDELNADNSNYWIFSEAGLLRLVERCGWSVLAVRKIGAVDASNPSTVEGDERAFLLLESRLGLENVNLLQGWYERDPAGWRWTAPEFAFEVVNIGRSQMLAMDIYVNRALRIETRLNGIPGASAMFEPAEGEQTLRQLVHKADRVLVEATVEPPIHGAGSDLRDFGVVVSNIRLE